MLRWYGRTDVIFQVGHAHNVLLTFPLLVCRPCLLHLLFLLLLLFLVSLHFLLLHFLLLFLLLLFLLFLSLLLLLLIFFLLLFPLYFLQAMHPMLYGADVEVINVLHPSMIQLLPIMHGWTHSQRYCPTLEGDSCQPARGLGST